MKSLIILLVFLKITAFISAQQFPFFEGYNINPFSLSPAYAGLYNKDFLFTDYRTDWTGIEGGPKSSQLSYSTRIKDNVGLGGKIVLDKSDIFRQTLVMGTYSYEVEIIANHFLNFALSAGFYRNSIDLGRYYDDPNYVADAVLMNGIERSKVKFASDLSTLYRYKSFEGGFLFSNLMFGSAKYQNSDISYKPLKNYLVHGSYNYRYSDMITIKPVILIRGGQQVPAYLELAPQVIIKNRVWGSFSFRTGGVWGLGIGAEAIDGIVLNYSYNLSSNVALNTYGGHQISLGFRLIDLPDFSR